MIHRSRRPAGSHRTVRRTGHAPAAAATPKITLLAAPPSGGPADVSTNTRCGAAGCGWRHLQRRDSSASAVWWPGGGGLLSVGADHERHRPRLLYYKVCSVGKIGSDRRRTAGVTSHREILYGNLNGVLRWMFSEYLRRFLYI